MDHAPTGVQKPVAAALQPARRARDLLPLLWAVGALALGIYVAASNLKLWRAISVEHPSTDKEVLELLEECRAQMGLRTLVALVTSAQVHTPVLLGFIRPRLLIPKDIATQLGHEELRYVFLHELAHVRRHDIALAWLTALLQVLHWFNPLVWLAFHRMRADRELACDALVLTRTRGEGTKDYGRAIVSLLERFSFPPPLPSLAGILENKSQLKRRIAMITQFQNNSYRWSAAGIGLITVLGAISMIDPARGAVSSSPTPEAKAPMTMRRVQKQTTGYAGLSPDGRYLCDCDTFLTEGIITIRELTTGVQRTVKPTKRTPAENGPQYSVLSPDNKTLAYVVWHGREMGWPDRGEVRLIGSDGSGQRVLCPALRPVQWFPDGRRLLGIRLPQGSREEIEIVLVSVADGAIQMIKTLRVDGSNFFSATIRLSPDAKYIAYELPTKDASAKRDICVVEIDSKRETPLVAHPADDKLLGWTPDGRHILFVSDRTGPWSAWLVPVSEGQTQGTPEQVARDIGDVAPVGFAEDGSFYYRLAYNYGNVYIAAINFTTGQLLSAPSPLEATGLNLGADWSPDGKFLAYCSQAGQAPREPRVIRIRSLATGQERELRHKLPMFRGVRWSPNGHSLLPSQVLAFTDDDMAWVKRVCRIDVDTGDTTILLERDKSRVGMAELSPDEKTLYYSRGPIVRRQLDTGEERELFTFPPNAPPAGWALSPNGEFIAVGCNEGTGKSSWEGGVKKLLVIPSLGGQATELFRWEEPTGLLTNVTWSNDKTVLFTLYRQSVTGGNARMIDEFWQVTTDGGQPRKIMEADGMCYGVSVHPDGQRIAFSSAGRRQELWAMENFLPADTSTKDSK